MSCGLLAISGKGESLTICTASFKDTRLKNFVKVLSTHKELGMRKMTFLEVCLRASLINRSQNLYPNQCQDLYMATPVAYPPYGH